MGVVIEESSIWEPNPVLFLLILLCCFLSITLFPNKSPSPSPFSHHSLPPSFHRHFLFFYSLSSVMEGVWSVFGEFGFLHHGYSKDQIVMYLCIGFGASLLFGSPLGLLSDSVGHNKLCFVFCILHLIAGIWTRVSSHPSVWLLPVCLSLATSISCFSFEALLVVENDKQGYRQDSLNDTFWLMTFLESAALIGSQLLSNWLVDSNVEKGFASSSTATIFLALLGVIFVSKGWKGTLQAAVAKDSGMSCTHMYSDKRILLLGFAHACLQFSIAIFWIVWAPTLVADGRQVHLGLIYPCLMGARMLGSTLFLWLFSSPSSLRTEDCLLYVFTVLGLALSIVAYDYQEIRVLVSLFCLFHLGVGLIIPSLARLRTMLVPSELRGEMISLSLVPANAAILFLLIQRTYYQTIENSTMVALSATGLFMAAGSMHLLKRWGKQPYQNWHKS